MSDLSQIAAQVVAPLHTTAHNVVADAFRLFVAPEEEYDESEVAIERLEFAAFAVGGLAAAATQPEAGKVRSHSRVDIPLSDSAGGTASAGIDVTLFGPGDVRGIELAQIVRRYPAPGTLTAEETVLAHVEFDRPELPWAFSAAPAAGALRPWVTLIVIERASASWEPASRMLPVLRVPLAELPSLAQVHLWAHAQSAQADNGAALPVRMSPEYAAVNLSRLLSPRVLREDTNYLAAVVPTTDVGVRGGLGLTGGTLGPAWTSASDDPVRLPVFDSWEFRTGPDGDFASLALRLQGVVAPYEVGRRFIDVSEPGRPLESLPAGAPGGKQVLRCALFSPTPPPTPERAEAEKAVWPDDMVAALRAELDLPAAIEGVQEQVDGVPELPIVGPRIYAKLHRGSAVITGNDWFAEVNLAPTKRIVAGLGTRVVQRDQEQLMQAAWAQLGEVEKANRAIQLAQLAELLASRIHRRLDNLQIGHLLQVIAPLASRVLPTAGHTLAADIAASATPASAVSGAFRRATRPDGPVLRRAATATRERSGGLVGSDTAMRDFTRTYRNPDGVGALSAASIAALDSVTVAAAVGITADRVSQVLTRANADLAGGVATHVTQPARWQPPAADFDLADSVVERWSTRVLTEPADTTIAEIRAQRVAPLAAELARSQVPAVSRHREQLERQAITLNNRIIDRVGQLPGGGNVAGGNVGGVIRGGGNVAGGNVAGGNIGGAIRGGAIREGVGGVGGGGVAGGAVRGGLGRVRIAGAGRLDVAGVGRVPVGEIRGLNQIDVTVLQRVPANSSAETRAAALANLAQLGEVSVSSVLEGLRTLPVDRFRANLAVLVDPGGALAIKPVPRRAPVAAQTVAAVTTLLDPAVTVRAAINGRLRLSDAIAPAWFAKPFLTPIMAAPRFDRPMYQALNDYNRDWLVPGLGLLPDDDFVTVLSTNSEFMEAFFLGLSDEMGRELLWRNYPTDQRGTYFRRFWDAHADELTQPIHAFSRTRLASHIAVGGTGGSSPRAVIVVKSELVRRYPDLIIQAVKNQGTVADPVFEKIGSPQQTAEQLFAAFLEPDIALVGVNLGIDEIDKPEWWILIAEHPTATRFDRPGNAPGPFLSVPGATESATVAKLRLHDPIRVAFQATDLIVTGA